MSFYNEYKKYKNLNYEALYNNINVDQVKRVLSKEKITREDFFALLSPAASECLEMMAQKAHKLSLKHFGKTILLYTPMYISNYCVNRCSYCGYNIDNKLHRKKLSLEEIEKEAKNIADQGFKHILILTGESPKDSPVSYIIEAVKIMKKYFQNIGIEIYPLTKEEYGKVIEAGVDSLTIYQETYNEDLYDKIHLSGPKKNYGFRLDAPERACQSFIHQVNIGALLGLDDWRKDTFMTGLHAEYLVNNYPEVEFSISLPRMRPHAGSFKDVKEVDDQSFVQILLALKIFLPFVGISLSTRERKEFRNHLIPLGVTKMSAGVSTKVGGHSIEEAGDGQFEISDERSLSQMQEIILSRGYQPILKDWMRL